MSSHHIRGFLAMGAVLVGGVWAQATDSTSASINTTDEPRTLSLGEPGTGALSEESAVGTRGEPMDHWRFDPPAGELIEFEVRSGDANFDPMVQVEVDGMVRAPSESYGWDAWSSFAYWNGADGESIDLVIRPKDSQRLARRSSQSETSRLNPHGPYTLSARVVTSEALVLDEAWTHPPGRWEQRLRLPVAADQSIALAASSESRPSLVVLDPAGNRHDSEIPTPSGDIQLTRLTFESPEDGIAYIRARVAVGGQVVASRVE